MMTAHNNIAWRNYPGNAGFEPSKNKWANDPHVCHHGIGNVPCGGYDLWETHEGVEPVNVGETPTHCNAEIYQELAGIIRVFHGIFLPYPSGFDTRYVSFNTEIGWVKITGTTADGFQFATTGDYTSRKYFALPSSGIVGGGSDLPASLQDDGILAAALRVWNTTYDAAVEIKFVATNPDVAFAGVRILEGTLDLALWDANQEEIESEWWSLTRWDYLDDLVSFMNGRPAPGGHGVWFMNALHATPTIIPCTALVPTGDYAQVGCLDEYLTLDEDLGVEADVSVTKVGPVTSFDIFFDDGEGGGPVTASYDLTAAAVDTLGELAAVLEARGENWKVDVEADTDLTSNLLLEFGQESVIGRARMAYLQADIDAGLIPRYRVKPTDWLYVDDPNSFANGRRYIIAGHNGAIDHVACTADVLGGPPADKVLFKPGVTEIWAKVVSVGTSFVERGWTDLWRSETPRPDLTLTNQFSTICNHQRLTGFNVRFGAAGDDRVYSELEDDFSNWLSCIECAKRNASNTTPESAQTTFMKFHKGAAGDGDYADWVAPGFMLTGNDTFREVEGCSGGPADDRCPHYEARGIRGAATLASFYSEILAGEWCCVRMPVAIPEPKYEWRSGESIASLVGQPRGKNTYLTAREHRWRISGGLGALPFPDTENDGWYQQLYWNSADNDDPDNLGQIATQLGDSRTVRRYGKAVSALSSTEFGATLLPLARHVLKSSWSAVRSIYERWGAQ